MRIPTRKQCQQHRDTHHRRELDPEIQPKVVRDVPPDGTRQAEQDCRHKQEPVEPFAHVLVHQRNEHRHERHRHRQAVPHQRLIARCQVVVARTEKRGHRTDEEHQPGLGKRRLALRNDKCDPCDADDQERQVGRHVEQVGHIEKLAVVREIMVCGVLCHRPSKHEAGQHRQANHDQHGLAPVAQCRATGQYGKGCRRILLCSHVWVHRSLLWV